MNKRAGLIFLFILVFFVAGETAHADTMSNWWRQNCSGQSSVIEGRNSPALRFDLGSTTARAQIGTPFRVTVEGALTEHATLSASDAQVVLGPKLCLDNTTPYGTDGCSAQGSSARYNFTQTATINGTARNIVIRSTGGGVLFPGDEGPSRNICKIVEVTGATNIIDITPPPSVPYRGKVVDEAGNPLSGASVTPKHAEVPNRTACPVVTTTSAGLYSFSSEQSDSDCFNAEEGWLDFKKTGYIGTRLMLEEEFDGIVPTVVVRRICQVPEGGDPSPQPPDTRLLVNGVPNSHQVMAGNPVTFTISNAVSGQVDVCYQVLRHPNFPNDPSVNVPESTACTDWANNWSSGNSEWQFNASNRTLTGTFSSSAVDAGGNPKWNIPGLKVRSSFRKSGTSEVVTATMTVARSGESYRWRASGHFSPAPPLCSTLGVSPTPNGSCTTPGMMCKDATYDYTCELQSSQPASGTTKSGIMGTVQGIASGIGNTVGGIIEGAGNIIGGVTGSLGNVLGGFVDWISSFFSDNNPIIQVLNSNTATVVNATWDGYAARALSGSSTIDFTYYPPTSGNPQVKGIRWSWSKTGGGETTGKNAYVWLTDQNDILISGDPNRAYGVTAGDLTSTSLTSGGKYRLHYVFPTGFQLSLNGIQVAPRAQLWNGLDNRTTDSMGRIAFVWESKLACGENDIIFTWSRIGSSSVATSTAKVWLTRNGNVVAGDPDTAQPGRLEAAGLENNGQYVLQHSLPAGERLSIMGTVAQSTTPPPGTNPPPNPTSDCPAGFQRPANMKTEQLGGPGNVNRIMNSSGQVVSIPLPAQPYNYTGGQLSIGENPTSPQGWDIDGNGNVDENEKMRLQVSINKCQGYVDTSPYQVGSSTLRNYCNISNTNGHYNSIRYIFETDSRNFTSREMVNRYGYCWVGDGGQYYVNARWTFPQCPHGAATCGFSFQHNPGGYPRSPNPTPTASECPAPPAGMVRATLSAPGSIFRPSLGSGQIMSIPLPKGFTLPQGTTTTYDSVKFMVAETANSPELTGRGLEISINKCPGVIDTDYTNKCNLASLNGHYNSITALNKPYSSTITSRDVANRYNVCWAADGGDYYANVRWTYGTCFNEPCNFLIQYNRGMW